MADQRQHYVWRHYIEAWGNDKGLVHFWRNGQEPRMTNPANVMVERGFYKLHRLDKPDMELIETFIEHTVSPDLKQRHRQLAGMFALVANSNELIQSRDMASSHEEKQIQDLVVKAEEMLHGYIESGAVSILDELRHKQKGFINSDESAAMFFNFITQQYYRTKNIREAFRAYFSRHSPSHNFAKIANIVCYISAVNLGSSLYRNRKDFDIVFLESNKGLGVVTGDQPIINLMANRYGGDTTEIIFYYPLSPNLSCLLAPKTYKLQSKQISSKIVERLNDFIVWHSDHFIVGNSDEVIRRAVKRQLSPNQSVMSILNCFAKDA